MKTRIPPLAFLLTSLPLILGAAPVLAQDGALGLFGPALAQVAQYTAEERRVLRERWEQAGPEERLQMRREFKERLRHMPPEGMPGFDPRAMPQSVERARRDAAGEAGFGFGFERRRYEEERVESPVPAYVPNPANFFDRQKNRERTRDGRRDDDRR